MTQPVEKAVQTASSKWKAAFNAGDAAGCASCYEPDATMVAQPFGTFNGRKEIEAFWSKLIGDGFTDVDYVDPEIEIIDETSARLRSAWTMNKAHGVITKEVWVVQDTGEALLREDHFEARG